MATARVRAVREICNSLPSTVGGVYMVELRTNGEDGPVHGSYRIEAPTNDCARQCTRNIAHAWACEFSAASYRTPAGSYGMVEYLCLKDVYTVLEGSSEVLLPSPAPGKAV